MSYVLCHMCTYSFSNIRAQLYNNCWWYRYPGWNDLALLGRGVRSYCFTVLVKSFRLSLDTSTGYLLTALLFGISLVPEVLYR